MPSEHYTVKYPVQKIPSKFTSNTKVAAQLNSLKIEKKKYTTNIDLRNFLTVYEYALGGNWVIWDYHHGLVFFTGLYKICNEGDKWDYLKIIDRYSMGDMASIKRIRGGYLKIQGTWIPYKLAYELSSKFAYKYRHQLIPLFGEKFVQDCVSPTQDNFKNFDKINIKNTNIPPSITLPNMKRRMSLNLDTSPATKRIVKKPRSKSFTSGETAEDGEDIRELKELLNASKQLHNFYKGSRTSKNDIFNYAGFLWKFTNNDQNLKMLGKADPPKDETMNRSTIIISGVKKPVTPIQKPLQSPTKQIEHTSFEKKTIDCPIASPKLNDLVFFQNASHFQNTSIITAPEDRNYSYTSNATTLTIPNATILHNDSSIPESIIDNSTTITGADESSLIPKDYDGIETILFAADPLNYDKLKIDLFVQSGLVLGSGLSSPVMGSQEPLLLQLLMDQRPDIAGDEANKENLGINCN